MIFCKNTIFAFLLIGALCCCFAKNSQHYNTMEPTIAWHDYNAINIQTENYIKNSSDARTNKARENTGKAIDGIGKGLGEFILTGLLVTVGLVALIVAIPIIIYNIGEKMVYSDNPLHNEFVHSSQRNKEESIQVKISPIMNLDNSSAGINAILSF